MDGARQHRQALDIEEFMRSHVFTLFRLSMSRLVRRDPKPKYFIFSLDSSVGVENV